jgi:O-antigen ligase
VLALAAIRSRAGIMLLIPSIVGSVLVVLRAGGFGRPRRTVLFAGIALAIAALLITQFGLRTLQQRFEMGLTTDVRFTVAPQVWAASLDHLPFGSGLGSFETVYRVVENRLLMGEAFINHAHNDFLELWLETGVPGLVILSLFLAVWMKGAFAAWEAQGPDAVFTQAGVVGTAILLTYSAVEYPLRTIALSTVFAFYCALVLAPVANRKRVRVRIGADASLCDTSAGSPSSVG